MDFFSNYITLIEFAILFSLTIIFSVLFFMQKKKTLHTKHMIDEFFEISTELADQALLVFDDKYKIIFISDDMDLYIDARKGDKLKNLKHPSVVKTDKGWIGIDEYIQYILKSDPEDTVFIEKAHLKIEKREKTVSIRISPFGEKDLGRGTFAGISIFDIHSKIKITDMHYINPISGLPNHNKALADIGLLSSKMAEEKKKFSIVIMSIDNFPELASILGYNKASMALTKIAKHLNEAAKQYELQLYQMPANNFLFVAPNVDNEKEIFDLVVILKQNINDTLLKTNKINLHFTLSSGISIFHNNSVSELMDNSYKALASAIKQGAGYSVVAENKSKKIEKEAKSSISHNDIKKALEDKEFVMYYQPVYDLKKDVVIGAEALVRWIHPTKGIIMPDDFIPISEETGFISEIGKFTLTAVIEQLSVWKKLGFKKVQIAINMSLRELESENPSDFIKALLIKNKIDSKQLKIEITENVATHDDKNSLQEFKKLKALNIDISLDDFGTGYSSFSMLEQFPIDTVKIDKSFVLDIVKNKNHQSIVKAMIAMIHAMGMKVIAEGVEDGKSMELLQEYDCDYIQGYFKGKPMPAFEYQQLIRSDEQEFQANHKDEEVKSESVVSNNDDELILI